MSLVDQWAIPGMGTPVESTEREFLAGIQSSYEMFGVVIVSTAADSTGTPTTLLRRGLVMGKVTATGKYKQYDPAATDGSQKARGVLYYDVDTLDASGTARDAVGRLVWFGYVKADQLIGLDTMARRQLGHRIWFDDGIDDADDYLPLVLAKTTAYTVLAADNNTTFTTQGAIGSVAFTLPTLGLRFQFLNEADQDMSVALAVADTMVTVNDLAADSVAFSTGGDKVGGCVEVVADADASKWLVFKRCSNAMTITT